MSYVEYDSHYRTPEDESSRLVPEFEHELEYWTNAAIEVGIPVDPDQPISTETIWEARNKLSRELGMAPTEWDGWTQEHSRAARIAIDLGVKSVEDTSKLGYDTDDLLTQSVRATYNHAPGLLLSSLPLTLGQMAELRDIRIAELKASRQS